MRETLIQQLQKLFGNISGDITTEWWIKLYNVPTALLYCFKCVQWLVFRLMLLQPLCLSAFSYSPLDLLKTSSLEEFFESLQLRSNLLELSVHRLVLIGEDGGLSTLCHNYGFDHYQKMLKKFPGPGYMYKPLEQILLSLL